MTKKELFVRFIEQTKAHESNERKFEEVLRLLNNENQLMGVISYDYYKMIQDMFMEAVGPELFEYAMWYLYDCSLMGEEDWILEIEGKEHLITTAEQLYDVITG